MPDSMPGGASPLAPFAAVNVPPWLNTLLIAALILAIPNLWTDCKSLDRQWSVDLRNRVVGARLMLAGQDPYFFKWRPGFPETWADPADPQTKSKVTRVTVTPAVLLCFAPFAPIYFPTMQWLWLGMEYAALLALFLLLWRTAADGIRRRVLALLFLLLAITSHFWHRHIEVGQNYIFFVLLLACAYRLCLAGPKFEWPAGLLLGAGVLLRPSLVVFLPALLLFGKRRLFLAGLAGVALAALLTVPLWADTWRSYFAAMEIWAQRHETSPFEPRPWLEPDCTYPAMVEGINSGILKLRWAPLDTSFSALFRRLFSSTIGASFALAALAALAGALSWPFLKRRSWTREDTQGAFLFASLMVLLSDFFLPAQRLAYTDVMGLLPLAIVLMEAEWTYLLYPPRLFFVLTGWLLCLNFPHSSAPWASWYFAGVVILLAMGLLTAPGARAKRELSVAPVCPPPRGAV